jgi:CheY-specific phosphatase CheX
MNVESINPFIESVGELCKTMLETPVERGKIGVSAGPSMPRELTALIGMTGFFKGTVALAFPTNTAVSLVNKLLGEENKVVNDTVVDGVAEFVNIVGGSAKAKFPIPAGERPVVLTLPIVVRGSDYKVHTARKTAWLEVPFTSALGNFTLRVTLEADLVS